jgi:hypothetical protein
MTDPGLNSKLRIIMLLVISVASLSASRLFAENKITAPAKGPLRVHPTNPRYFTDGSGKAVYLAAAHTWANLQEIGIMDPPSVFDYDGYLKFLTDHNHNFIRLWRWETPKDIEKEGFFRYCEPHPWKRTGPGMAWDGKPKFNLEQFDEGYFERIRKRVAAARDRGIYVSIMLFEGWGLQFSNWDGHPFNVNNNINGINGDTNGDGHGIEVQISPLPAGVEKIQKAYLQKVIDTVNDLDNVLYEIANESGSYSTDWQYDMIRYVKSREALKPKQHPVGMTFQYKNGRNSTLFSSPADWVSPNPDTDVTDAFNYRDNPPPGDGSKVILSDTDHLWGVGGDRIWVWKSFLRGLNPLWMDPYDGRGWWEPVPVYGEDTRKSLGYTRTYADKVNLAAMTPQNKLASTAYCLANPGSEYLVYQPDSGAFTLNLVSGTYSYEWFNPSTGSVITTGAFVADGGQKSFSPPFSGDVLLYLKRSDPSPSTPAP